MEGVGRDDVCEGWGMMTYPSKYLTAIVPHDTFAALVVVSWCSLDNLYLMCAKSIAKYYAIESVYFQLISNNETCLVTCVVSLNPATWHMYLHSVLQSTPQ